MKMWLGYLFVVFVSVGVFGSEAQACDINHLSDLNSQVSELYGSGKYHEAILIAEKSLQIAESSCGSDHLITAISLDNMADLYRTHDQNDEAEPLYHRALKIREKQLGPDHPSTATSLCNLAELYSAEGRYEEAEPLYQRAVEIREKQLGADHPDTIQSIEDLAEFYRTHGQ